MSPKRKKKRHAGRRSSKPNLPTISLCMIVRNEAENLPDCLGPLAGELDDVVVVDTGSTDGTQGIAAELGARVYEFQWQDDFSAARNVSLEHAKGEWILWLDADDRMHPGELAKLRNLAAQGKDKAYFLTLVNEQYGLDEMNTCNQLRFFPNVSGVRFRGRVHEQVIYALRGLGITFLNCGVVVIHVGYKTEQATRTKLERNRRLLEQELKEHPTDPTIPYHLAHCHRSAGRKREAIRCLRRVIERSSARETNREIYLYAHLMLAVLYREMDDHPLVDQIMSKVLAEEPDYHLGHYMRGDWLWEQGRKREAIRELLRVDPEKIRGGTIPVPLKAIRYMTHYLLALMYESLGSNDLARAEYRRALSAAPHSHQAHAGVGDFLLRRGEFLRAISHLEQATKLAPEIGSIWYSLGSAYLEARDLEHAGRALNEALRLDPTRPWAHLKYGNVLFQSSDFETASKYYGNALKLRPNLHVARNNLAKALLCLGRFEEARGMFEQVIRSAPQFLDALAHLGDIHFEKRQWDRALHFYERFIEKDPKNPVTLCRIGECYEQMGAPQASRLAYEKALEASPSNSRARQLLTRLSLNHAQPYSTPLAETSH